MEYPYITPVGGKYAVAKIGPLVISGFLGWVLKGLVELNYLLSIMPTFRAFKTWLKGLKIFIQNDRLG
jgi:NADH dehydrogenase FAD-containing subunit